MSANAERGVRPAPARIIFIRHGAADGTSGRCIGRTDVPLSAAGAEAIRALVAANMRLWLSQAPSRDAVRVISSDLRRALDSASIIAATLGVPLETDGRLREMDFGDWDGRLWSEIEGCDSDRLRDWMERWQTNGHPPNGEALDVFAGRADAWLAGIVAWFRDCPGIVVAVSHAGFIRTAISRLRCQPLARMFEIDIAHAEALLVDWPLSELARDGEAFRTAGKSMNTRADPRRT